MIRVIGDGGHAREVMSYLEDANKRYIHITELPINTNNFVVIGIGVQDIRKRILEYCIENRIAIYSLTHPSALVYGTVGEGNTICPHVIIGPDAYIGDYNLINYNTAIAHDCAVGNMNIFCPSVNILGVCGIGNDNFFGTGCTVLPGVSIGNRNKIQAGIVVDQNVGDDMIVFTRQKVYQRGKV